MIIDTSAIIAILNDEPERQWAKKGSVNNS